MDPTNRYLLLLPSGHSILSYIVVFAAHIRAHWSISSLWQSPVDDFWLSRMLLKLKKEPVSYRFNREETKLDFYVYMLTLQNFKVLECLIFTDIIIMWGCSWAAWRADDRCLVGPNPVFFITIYLCTSILLKVLIFFVWVSGKGQW